MPLTEPVAREHVHSRDVACRGYRRDDGLWDIEGRLVDAKTYAFKNRSRGTVEPGDPVHDMWLRLTIVQPGMLAAPDYARMVGTRIRSGWTREVRARLGKVEGCTHLTRLLEELAVVAAQTVWPLRKKR